MTPQTSYVHLTIRRRSNEVEIWSEQLLLSFTETVNQIGDLAGLHLGFNFAFIVEVLELLVHLVQAVKLK